MTLREEDDDWGQDPDPELSRDRALVRALMRRAAKARTDPAAFFEFVMREETTRERIRTLPHQRLVLEFVAAHPVCVIRMPVGFSKTYLMIALSLFFLGEDPTNRGLIISDTQGQASKPLLAVRDYIERSAELHAVFPALRPTQRAGDQWTQTALVVDRPFGIRDPSLAAVGDQGAVAGSRLSWAVVDDVLSLENTTTQALREKTHRWFESTVMSRLDPKNSRLAVTNTPWVGASESDPGDLTYVLEAAGVPTLTMSAFGGIWITNAPNFDSDELRPAAASSRPEDEHRLKAHDAPEYLAAAYPNGAPPNPDRDEEEIVPLWPERYSLAWLEAKRATTRAREFAQNYECKARSEADDRIKEIWIRHSLDEGKRTGHYRFATTAPPGDLPVFTGVDVAIGQTTRHHRSALFTIAILPDRRRLLLDIEVGRFTGGELVAKVISKHETFGAIVRVENNAAQDFLLQWIRDKDKTVPIRAHTTGKNKADPRHGVESLFIEFEQGAWILPCGVDGRPPRAVLEFLQAMRQYEPGAHTGDILMAAWLAREQARKSGALIRPDESSLAALLSR
jgi:hypothetical protein